MNSKTLPKKYRVKQTTKMKCFVWNGDLKELFEITWQDERTSKIVLQGDFPLLTTGG